jgi:hypothetical protein
MKSSIKLSSLVIGFSFLTFCCNALASLGDISDIKWYMAIEGAGVGIILGSISWFTEKIGYKTSVVIFFTLSAIGSLFIEPSFEIMIVIIVLQATFAFIPMLACFMILQLFKSAVNSNSNPSFKRDA